MVEGEELGFNILHLDQRAGAYHPCFSYVCSAFRGIAVTFQQQIFQKITAGGFLA